MIRHTVMFKFDEGYDFTQWLGATRRLPNDIPGMHNVFLGTAVPREGRQAEYDALLVVDFEDMSAVRAYQEHPAHAPVSAMSSSNCTSILSMDFTPIV